MTITFLIYRQTAKTATCRFYSAMTPSEIKTTSGGVGGLGGLAVIRECNCPCLG